MSNNSEQDPLARACELVGRFIYHFGRVERKIDDAVIKLLDLSEKLTPVVTAVDFAKKLRLVKLSADTQITDPAEKENAHNICSRVYTLNDDRILIAHSDFDAAAGGVQFGKRTTKDGRVLDAGPLWSDTQFNASYEKMSALEADLDQLIKRLKPDEPAVKWFIPGLIPELPAHLRSPSPLSQLLGHPDPKPSD